MPQIGNRIIYDQDGEIICQLGEMQGDVSPRKDIMAVDFVDLEFGQIDYTKHKLIGVKPQTKELILEEIPHIETEIERLQREKQELEDQLLLQADAEVGGIL